MVSKIFVDTPDDFRALRFFEKHGFSSYSFFHFFLCFSFSFSFFSSNLKSQYSKKTNRFKNPIFETFLSLNIEDIPISATSKTDLIKFGTGIKIEGNGEGKETETKKTEKEIIEKEKEEEKEKETKEEAGRVIVREMGVTDFYEVLKLGNEVFHDDVFWDEGEIVDMFQTDAECCLVAEKDSRIVGLFFFCFFVFLFFCFFFFVFCFFVFLFFCFCFCFCFVFVFFYVFVFVFYVFFEIFFLSNSNFSILSILSLLFFSLSPIIF